MKKLFYLCLAAIVLGVSLTGFTDQALAKISIKNQLISQKVRASVSTWGTGGNTSIYTIEPGKTESWKRSDPDGVLVVNHSANKTYFMSSFESVVTEYGSDDTQVFQTTYGQLFYPINTDVPSGTNGKIKVKNNSNATIQVAINKWGSGNGTYFTLNPGNSESWSRNDERGYIMAIKNENNYRKYYYIKHGKDIEINSLGEPTIDGVRIQQIFMPGKM